MTFEKTLKDYHAYFVEIAQAEQEREFLKSIGFGQYGRNDSEVIIRGNSNEGLIYGDELDCNCEIKAETITSLDGAWSFNLNTGEYTVIVDDPELDENTVELFKTKGNAYYSVFEDEEEEALRIEIDPEWLWSKEDIHELIGKLEELSGIKEERVKPTLVVTYPGSISQEKADLISNYVDRSVGAKALILEEGGKAYLL